jgi:cytochrome c peroxidase
MRGFALLGAFVVMAAVVACEDAPPDEERALADKELLGKRLFEDANLSEPFGQSCASCHEPTRAFTGNAGSPVAAVARGSRDDRLGKRNVPSAAYAMYSPPFGVSREANGQGGVDLVPQGGQFWDGRATSLAEQAKGPFLNPAEMNNPDKAAVVAKVRQSVYARLFRKVYGNAIFDDVDAAYDAIGEAIAAYEQTRTFNPFSSKFDSFLRGEVALEPEEQRGFDLFRDPQKGNCLACHAGGGDSGASKLPEDWLFTDFTYDALGVPRNRSIPANDDPTHFDLGLCARLGLNADAPAGFDEASTCGAFKVPTLRNVARTAPYMHNGYFTGLRDVVRFYATRDTNPELWYPRGPDGRPQKFDDLPPRHRGNVNTQEVPYDRKHGDAPRLDASEIDAIVAFLETLTDA